MYFELFTVPGLTATPTASAADQGLRETGQEQATGAAPGGEGIGARLRSISLIPVRIAQLLLGRVNQGMLS